VKAIVAAIEAGNTDNSIKTYNLGTGESYSVKEIADIVCTFFSSDIEYICTHEFRPNDVMDTVADISKIKNELNWQPEISIHEGLKKMI